jgi:alkylated DNA repair dioxygenase AlkB
MSEALAINFQPSLFDPRDASFDASFSQLQRVALDDSAWVDYAPEWVRGSDSLFGELVRARKWGQRTRWMYEKRVIEPRLTDMWMLESGAPLQPLVLDQMRLGLSERYGVLFDSAGFNFYRDGQDSVAWHGDRIRKEIVDPVVALVSLGERRKFLLRPKSGGRSRTFALGRGDLLVTGGNAQRQWQHSVPKVAHAGPRISIAFRHGMNARAYGRAE